MSRFNVIAVVAVVLVLAAAPATAQLTTNQCAKVVVSPIGGSGAPSQLGGGGALSVREFEDLKLAALFLTEVEGDHILEFKVFTPRGHLYETLTAPISSDPAAPRTVKVPNYPRPLPTQRLQPFTTREGTFTGSTTMTLPVAGTAIVTNSLYGRWRVEVLLDQELITCRGGRGSFILTE